MNEAAGKVDQKEELYQVFPGPAITNNHRHKSEWEDFKSLIPSIKAKEFADIWFQKTINKGVPFRKDFSFKELVRYGNNLSIIRLTEGRQWLVTYCGVGLCQAFGGDPTGKLISEIADPITKEYWTENLKLIMKENKPFVEFFTLDFIQKGDVYCSALNLPLMSGDHDFPDVCMAYLTFSYKDLRQK